MKIVGDYLRERSQHCFSYEGIYAYYERCCRDSLPATTLDRTIRRLAEKGLLERREVRPDSRKPTSKRKTVIFCWTSSAESVYQELKQREEERRESRLRELLAKQLGSDAILRVISSPSHELEFFATGAPEWWPFKLMTISQKSTPNRNNVVLLDNNAFKYWRKNEWPDFDKWVYELRVAALRLANIAQEVRVILPDKPRDPKTSFEWYTRSYRMLCSDTMLKSGVRCVATAHFDPSSPIISLKSMIEHIIDSMPNVEIIASPTKPYCGRFKTDKIVVSDACFIGIVGRVASIVNGKKRVHVLAPPLRVNVLQRVAPLINSFDTTSWTRPIHSELRRLGIKHSAKDSRERELLFAFTVAYLVSKGIPLRYSQAAIDRLPNELREKLGV